MSDVLEEWAKCQGEWMYLQPIFDSADIATVGARIQKV